MSGTPSLRISWRRCGGAVLAAAACAVLAGCADVGRALSFGGNEVNVESPVAPAAVAATKVRYVTPRFSDVPPAPHNIPSPTMLRQRVQGEVAARDRLDGWVATHPQATDDTEGFAATRRAVAAKGGSAPVQDHTAAADAWAAQARAAAVPPPPPQ